MGVSEENLSQEIFPRPRRGMGPNPGQQKRVTAYIMRCKASNRAAYRAHCPVYVRLGVWAFGRCPSTARQAWPASR